MPHKPNDHLLSLETARRVFYVEDDVLMWGEVSGMNIITAGTPVGYQMRSGNTVYMACTYMDRHFYNHRIIWLLYYGKWPAGFIDHVNHNGLDNRIENMRDVPHAKNLKNKKLYKNNTSGVPGVGWFKKCQKWVVHITVNGKVMCLGYFADKAEAISVRKAAEVTHGFHENHGKQYGQFPSA